MLGCSDGHSIHSHLVLYIFHCISGYSNFVLSFREWSGGTVATSSILLDCGWWHDQINVAVPSMCHVSDLTNLGLERLLRRIFFSSERKGPKCGMRLQCDCVSCLSHPMHTCCISRSPTQAASDSPPQGPSQPRQLTAPTETKHSLWSIQEERELIDFLSNHKAEAGDGVNFKQAIWTQAAAYMSTLHPNVTFGTNQCSSKWGRVHHY